MPVKVSFPTSVDNIALGVDTVELAEELSTSFRQYAMSVVTDRALPDARDGLKPVQRKILWAMYRLRLTPAGEHRKCASIVGETMGKYHPHGDASIYKSMVRMGQPFVCNAPLVDPRGNFGSLDDPPAAYRYTEARPSLAAAIMMRGIEEHAVGLSDTFDGGGLEPAVLPAGFPQLLVNGAQGIAVGVRTVIPPHNLSEITSALGAVLEAGRRRIPVDQLMEHVPGPDYPSGGTIRSTDGIRRLYETGSGSFTLQGTATPQPFGHRKRIVITELPYQVGAEAMVSAVRTAKTEGKAKDVISVEDLSDRTSGLRIVIVCRKGANPKQVIASLRKTTPLDRRMHCNLTVLQDGQPRKLPLWDLLRVYADHRIRVAVRRAEFVRAMSAKQAHRLRGLSAAAEHADEVMATIRDPSLGSPRETRAALRGLLGVDEQQAEAVMSMTLKAFQPSERAVLAAKLGALEKTIADSETLLASEQKQRSTTAASLSRAEQALGWTRRTRIL